MGISPLSSDVNENYAGGGLAPPPVNTQKKILSLIANCHTISSMFIDLKKMNKLSKNTLLLL
jgi:hypothetical protein